LPWPAVALYTAALPQPFAFSAMNPLRAVKGMNDVLPGESARWQKLETAFARTMALHAFREVRTPYLEPTSLFVRAIGEGTDVVEKEMYSFVHRDEPLTLRPEGTAGTARAYVEHAVHNSEPVSRWYYVGPMFRAERPQRGRYRQFSQAGAEIYGDPGPACDAEMIDMLVGFVHAIGVHDARVEINSLGAAGAREKYKAALVGHLTPLASSLSEESRRRLATNPLRILDSKDPRDAEAVRGAPTILEALDAEDVRHFDRLCRALDALGTPYAVSPRLVRGLDYYTRTLFEIKGATEILGAGDTLVGGGRYDRMIEELGGPSVPAIGFAAGLDRLLLASAADPAPRGAEVFLAPLGEDSSAHALVLAKEIRGAGFACEVDARGASLKAILRRANALGARLAIILGENEIGEGTVQIKDLAAQSQDKVPREGAVAHVAEKLRGARS
jgi:histidyl-tRNA synthetase